MSRQTKRCKPAEEHLSVLTFHEPQRSGANQPLRALTETQGHYILAIQSSTLIFATGPAGTGKTLIPVALAAEQLVSKSIDKLLITRPVMETGRTLGYLPGEQSDKFAPYIAPLIDALTWRLGKSQLEYAMKIGRVQATPLELMRGTTFNDCWVILDEAQNVTKEQMLMFLTRIGRNCKVVITGDPRQCDLKSGQVSGLMDAIERCAAIPSVRAIEFCQDDVVRSGIVKDILCAYSK